MMEPTSTTGKAGAPLSPLEASPTKANTAAPVSATTSAAATASTGASSISTSAVPSSTTSATSTTGLQGMSFKMPANVQMPNVPMPKVLKDKTDDISNRITTTDIKRINGYMRFANLGAAILLAVTCFIRMFMARSYSDFLVVIYIIGMAIGLVFVENHEQFPSLAEKVKNNFGFMFTAPGKAAYIMAISFLSFSQGWIGTLLGIFFLLLALFNFFLIKRHPAYQEHMTQTKQTSSSQEQADLEAMPELRYNQSQPAAQTAHVVV